MSRSTINPALARCRSYAAVCAVTLATITTGCRNFPIEGRSLLGILPTQPPKPMWSGSLESTNQSNGSKADQGTVSGSVAIVPGETPNTDYALVSIENGTPGHIYSWQIHTGSCASLGDSIVTLDRVPRLTPLPDGTANVEYLIAQQLNRKNHYSAVITASATDKTPVACGQLTPSVM